VLRREKSSLAMNVSHIGLCRLEASSIRPIAWCTLREYMDYCADSERCFRSAISCNSVTESVAHQHHKTEEQTKKDDFSNYY
jgi:hypothetical protein